MLIEHVKDALLLAIEILFVFGLMIPELRHGTPLRELAALSNPPIVGVIWKFLQHSYKLKNVSW